LSASGGEAAGALIRISNDREAVVQAVPLAFLQRLVETPGPVGSEGPVQEVFREYLEPYADAFEETTHGSLAAIRNPGGSPRVVVTGHADEIGLIVHHIDDKGFVYFRRLGGVDAATVVSAMVEIHTRKGIVPGVVGRKPIHLQETEDRTKLPKLKTLYIDIGATSKKDAERQVRPGDPVTFRRNFTRLGKDRVSSKAMDNRTGVFCAAEVLRRLGRTKPRACVIALSTVGEEIGGLGASTASYTLQPDVAIAVDVTFTSDQPEVSVADGGDVKIGAGPVITRGPRLNPTVVSLLEKAAKKASVPVQYDITGGYTGTDGDGIYPVRGGVPLGVIGVPNRYMHTPVEVCSLKDLDQISAMLTTFVKDLGPKTAFDPFS
jgi:endoglucanase